MTIVYFLKPDIMKRLMEFFKQGRRMYFAAMIRLVLAVVFLLAARQCRHFWVIFVFGVLFIISGLLVFILGLEKVKSYISWWQKQPLVLLRVVALIGLAIGAIIIYSA
jgi:energy-coupling factor transporter transmembrane protein EcfT